MKVTMKALFGFMLFLSIHCNSQKLTLSDLHMMSANKNWETSNKYLLSKGWEYYDSSVGDDFHYNTISWSYEKSYSDDKKANGWIYIFTYDGLPNKVLYRFRKKEYYTTIKNSLTANGYKLDDEEILDQRVIARYSNANYIMTLTYAREESDEDDSYSGAQSYTAYEISVFKKGGVYDPNNGKKEEFDEDGNLAVEYVLKNGKAEGPITYYNPNGTVRRTSYMKAGFENGITTEFIYSPNDSLKTPLGKYKGELVNGERNGKWLLNVIKDNVESTLSYENYNMGVKNGPFTSVSNDSLIAGRYKNDKLEGPYTIYRDLKKMLIGGLITTDTLQLKKIVTGQYKDNKKAGLWKTYSLSNTLIEEGTFVDSLQTGKWKYYYDTYIGENDKVEEFSGELYLEENYLRGQKNGISIRYSFFDETEGPCADDSTKTCTIRTFKRIKETATYKNDLLDGPYELLNEKNEVLYKGNYSEGKETGLWTNKTVSLVDFWRGETIEKGMYSNGLRQQKWDRFDSEGKLVESCTYKDDMLNGEQISYFKGQPRIKRIFSAGDFTDMTVLDSLGFKVFEYKLFDKRPDLYKCTAKLYYTGKVVTNTYRIELSAGEEIVPAFFHNYFKELPDDKRILDGYHQVANETDILESGTYYNNQKAGIWTFYFYDQNVKLMTTYNAAGDPVKEEYYDMRKKEPFSGEFIFKNEDTGLTEERKIKDGMRNGTTRYRDANNKTITKESYKDGVLKD